MICGQLVTKPDSLNESRSTSLAAVAKAISSLLRPGKEGRLRTSAMMPQPNGIPDMGCINNINHPNWRFMIGFTTLPQSSTWKGTSFDVEPPNGFFHVRTVFLQFAIS